jgi:hypothetical protein
MTDDELYDRLRAADPASTLPSADPDRVARLLEDVMSTELTTHPETGESRETGTHGRSRLTWLVAAAAVVVIAGGAVFALLGHDDTPPAPPTAVDSQTVTELGAPTQEAYAARCMAPNAKVLSTQSVAVDATVTTVAGGIVTLEANHWYAGDHTDLVRVQAPAADLERLLVSVDFTEGHRYLVAANDGQVAICGLSAPYSQGLADLYAEAFGTPS